MKIRHFVLAGLLPFLTFSACKNREFNASTVAGERTNNSVLSTGPKITYGFHWNKEAVAKTNPSFVVRNLAGQGERRLLDGNAAGSGLYLANDPFSSQSHGDTLIVVPILPNSSGLVATPAVSSDQVTRPEQIIMYYYGGKMFESPSSDKVIQFVGVVRDRSIISYNDVFSIPFDKSKCPGNFTRERFIKQGQNWRDYLKSNIGVLCEGNPPKVLQVEELVKSFSDIPSMKSLSQEKFYGSLFARFAGDSFLADLMKFDLARIYEHPFCKGQSPSQITKEGCIAIALEVVVLNISFHLGKPLYELLKTTGFTALGIPEKNNLEKVKEFHNDVYKTLCAKAGSACTATGFADFYNTKIKAKQEKEAAVYKFLEEGRTALYRAIYEESMAVWK